jgi:hypothetical protein
MDRMGLSKVIRFQWEFQRSTLQCGGLEELHWLLGRETDVEEEVHIFRAL